jgi:hypothetical protein
MAERPGGRIEPVRAPLGGAPRIDFGWLRARLWLLSITVIAVSVVLSIQTFGFDWGRSDGDPWNYLAAGERLNAGHPLYALSSGDRPVVVVPPYWSVPLLAPPPIAVLWRPLAALGPSSMWLWGLACLVGVVASSIHLARGGAHWVVALLATSLTLTALSGNASALVLPMVIGAWAFRDRPWIVGVLIATAAAIKLTPIVLVIWLLATRRWHAIGATLIAGGAIGFVSFLGAGVDAYSGWLAGAGAASPSPSAIATQLGVSPAAVAALFALPVLLLWGRDRPSFSAAVVAAALATPALYFSAFALLAAVVAPWIRAREPRPIDRPATSIPGLPGAGSGRNTNAQSGGD